MKEGKRKGGGGEALGQRRGQNKEFHLNLISCYQQKSEKMPRIKTLRYNGRATEKLLLKSLCQAAGSGFQHKRNFKKIGAS